MRNPAQRAARNANNTPISSPSFQVNIKFVPGYRRYSDANPEQTASLPGRAGRLDRLGDATFRFANRPDVAHRKDQWRLSHVCRHTPIDGEACSDGI
jgi:hypothetical protein